MVNNSREVSVLGRSFKTTGDDDFWIRMEQNSWEPETLSFLDEFLVSGNIFVDIGAWIGPTTLLAASKGANCHSFEPDPVAFKKFTANVNGNSDELRSRVNANQLAITSHGSPVQLYTRYSFGDSGSSILSRIKDEGSSVEVGSTTLMEYVQQKALDRIDLIKMDIEGGEFDVIPAIGDVLSKYKPVVYLALHFPYLIESASKSGYPNRVFRRVRRMAFESLGMDPYKREKKQALESLKRVLRSFKDHPYVYSSDLRPMIMDPLPEELFGLVELVFSPRPLQPK